jgi:hypothetical protein
VTDRAQGTDRVDVRQRLTAIAPIAAMRSTRADTLEEALDGFPVASVECRLGGAYIQAHRDDGDVVIFDRAGVDVTEQLDGVVDVVRALPGGDVVLEGNVIRFDADGSPVDASDLLLDELADGGGDLGACFVDLLAADGHLLDEPLATRLQMLDDLLPPANLVPRAEVGDVAEAKRIFDEAARRGYPGVVVKDLTSPYVPGRRSRSWRHVVPVHVLNLIVIGAQRGSGRRAGWFSTLLLGASTADGGVMMVGKTSSGLTDEMLDWQTTRFQELALDVDDHGSDVLHLRPEQLVEVAVDVVLESTRYPSGVSLQTAKVRRYLSAPVGDAADVGSIRALAGEPWRSRPDVPTLPERPHGPATRPTAAAGVADPDSSSSVERLTSPSLPLSLQDQLTGRRSPVTEIDFDFPPFEAPRLLSLRFASVLVMATRLAAIAWIVLLARTALDAEPSSVGGAAVADVRTVGTYGFAVVAAICVAGWWWSDRRTRNAHRLDGRRPGRFRCLTAWSAPIVLPAAVGFTVLQLEPSEPFDVRPSIALAVLAFALSRPISLVRRILATLIRVRFDGLIGVSFVLDFAAFGLIAWRLAVWPDPGDALSVGEVDTLVVVCAATFVVLLLGLVDWAWVLRTAASAEAHRATSQRTRNEHRMLRLRNADPTDPAVWWALVSRRASEQRELEASERAADRHDQLLVIPSADEFVEQARRQHRRALTRLGPKRADVLLGQLRAEFLSVTEEVRAAAADALGDVSPSVARSVSGDAAGESPSSDSLSAFRWRLGTNWDETEATPGGALEQLLEHAGSIQIEAALAERRRDGEATGIERTLPPKLYTLESARAMLLVALIATAAAAVWLVSLTVGASLLADNEALSSEGVARIERARLAISQAFSVTLVGATLWSWAIAVHARRCGTPSSPTRSSLLCFLVASAASAAMFLVDGAGEGVKALTVLLPATVCAVVSVVALQPVARWFRLRTGPLVMWAAGLPMILVLERISRLNDDIGRQVNLQSQTFFAILIGLSCALVCVVVASSTMELEDGIRLAPELAVPADRERGSGSGPRGRRRVPARR